MPKGKHNNHAHGSTCKRWNDNKIISSHGYPKIRVGKFHPYADPNGYAYEHLIVWVSAGNQLPQKDEVIHHVNDDKTDNRLENLKVITRAEHNVLHNAKRVRNEAGQFIVANRIRNERP